MKKLIVAGIIAVSSVSAFASPADECWNAADKHFNNMREQSFLATSSYAKQTIMLAASKTYEMDAKRCGKIREQERLHPNCSDAQVQLLANLWSEAVQISNPNLHQVKAQVESVDGKTLLLKAVHPMLNKFYFEYGDGYVVGKRAIEVMKSQLAQCNVSYVAVGSDNLSENEAILSIQ